MGVIIATHPASGTNIIKGKVVVPTDFMVLYQRSFVSDAFLFG